MTIDIERNGEGARLEITDRVERRRVSLRFPSAVETAPAAADEFVYPVDRAVSVTTDSLTVECGAAATVLDGDGETRANVGTESWTGEVEPGEYYLQVSTHLKTYLWVDAPAGIAIEADEENSTVEVDFREPVAVRIGARSPHERPAATITTSPAPEDVMEAVSHLGSALKDDGPMRSFPSLRGHPPEIELGDELDVPEALDRPDSGVSLVVPPDYEHVFAAAPLAYYLGAEVVPGEPARLVTETGYEHPLAGPDGFEAAVERVLKQVFACDCYVRSAGPYSYGLARREAFVRETGIEPGAVYDRPLAEQVEAYLAVPFEVVEPFVPRWGASAHLEPVPDSVEYLPFLANDLATIRSPSAETVGAAGTAVAAQPDAGTASGGEFTRSAADAGALDAGPTGPGETGGPVGPPGPSIEADLAGTDASPVSAWPTERPGVVRPDPTDAQEQLWIGDGVPLGADKPTLESYRNALERDPVEGDIEILVVCNDDRMAEEDDAVRRLLDGQTTMDVEVRPFRNLMTHELRELLERGADFLHYIGHIDERGFACPDGYLDTATLEAANVDAFFLNACSSYEQGRGLIDAGAIAGVVTLEDVRNGDAVRAGRLMARLLDKGFPLNTALRIAGEVHGIEDQYTVVGKGGLQVVQAETNAHLIDVEMVDAETFDYRFDAYVTPQFELGAAYAPTIDAVEGWYLFGDPAEARVDHETLCESLYEEAPVRFDGEFGWSSELAERLCTLAEFGPRLHEVASLAVEVASRSNEATDEYADLAARLGELREQLERGFADFGTEDFRVAYRTLGEEPDEGDPRSAYRSIGTDEFRRGDRPRGVREAYRSL